MKQRHHTLTIDATQEFLGNNHTMLPNIIHGLNDIKRLIGEWSSGMKLWIAQADDFEDIVIDGWLDRRIVDGISKATSFQHFAFCDPDGPSPSGEYEGPRYGGYCWNNDKSLADINSLANLISSNVRCNPQWCIFTFTGNKISPSLQNIKGDKKWTEQVYPSAIEMAKFYGDCAGDFKKKDGDASQRAVQSLCFAIHMLQDLGVYHHVVCDVSAEHAGFEEKIYKDIGNIEMTEINIQVKNKLDGEIGNAAGFEDLGKKLVNLAYYRFKGWQKPSANKGESMEVTAQAIACVIKATDLFLS